MSSVPHVASTDRLKEQRYSLMRFGNPSTDNWEGANFMLLSGLSAFSWCFLPPQLIRWSHPESFSLVTPLGQADVLAVPTKFYEQRMHWLWQILVDISTVCLSLWNMQSSCGKCCSIFKKWYRHLNEVSGQWIFRTIIAISRLEIGNVLSVAQHSHNSCLKDEDASQSTKSVPHHFL